MTRRILAMADGGTAMGDIRECPSADFISEARRFNLRVEAGGGIKRLEWASLARGRDGRPIDLGGRLDIAKVGLETDCPFSYPSGRSRPE